MEKAQRVERKMSVAVGFGLFNVITFNYAVISKLLIQVCCFGTK